MKTKLRLIVIGFALISTLVLSGCNTAKGIGQDVERGGQVIQHASGH